MNSFGLIFFFSKMTFASKDDPTLRLADILFNWQAYEEAVTEYKRYIFFHPESSMVDYAYYKMGLAYRADYHWPEAIDAFEKSIQNTVDDSLRDERRILLGTTLIAGGDYNAAHLELFKVSQVSPFQTLRCKASYFQGLAYLYTFHWESARQAFQIFYTPSSHSTAWHTIDSLLVEAQHLPYKSPTTAKLLSTVIPGVGQVYVGHWKAGVNALVLDGLLGVFAVRSVVQKRHFDISLLLLTLFERYYFGNRYHAALSAERYNEQLKRRYVEHAVNVLTEEQVEEVADNIDTKDYKR